MTPTDQHWTFQCAVEYGGSFYRALGHAGLLADANNRAKIFAAWPDMVTVYGPATQLHRQLRAR
jgi:hypothetical protein